VDAATQSNGYAAWRRPRERRQHAPAHDPPSGMYVVAAELGIALCYPVDVRIWGTLMRAVKQGAAAAYDAALARLRRRILKLVPTSQRSSS
jgi:hypothetical protein